MLLLVRKLFTIKINCQMLLIITIFISNDSVHMYDTLHKSDLHRHKINTSYFYRCLKYKGIKMWIHYPVVSSILNRLRILNIWSRIIC